jgi:ABC-type iron transport system FetAB permease component
MPARGLTSGGWITLAPGLSGSTAASYMIHLHICKQSILSITIYVYTSIFVYIHLEISEFVGNPFIFVKSYHPIPLASILIGA